MEKNNGKIAIAIVAMFVVALSIVGVTYAYFTATVKGNESDDYSVEVDAGRLEVDYLGTKTIEAYNIVPGWISDGNMYYDPVASIQDVPVIDTDTGLPVEPAQTVKGIIAVNKNDYTEASNTQYQNKNYGLTNPIEFNVTNDGTDTAHYAVRLVDIVNGIASTDVDEEGKSNFKYKLYESKETIPEEGQTVTPTFEEAEVVAEGELSHETEQTILATTSVEVGGVNYYQLVLYYEDFGNQNASASDSEDEPKSVSVTVEVVGLNQTGTALAD